MDEETILDPPMAMSHAAFEAMFPDLTKLPTDLPGEDLVPMETYRHFQQMCLLCDVIRFAWWDRQDVFVGGNMFVYFSADQAESVKVEVAREVETGQVLPPSKRSYRGPDVFAVTNIDGARLRDFWIVWNEGGHYPDLIIELLSPSTRKIDLTTKKQLYEQVFKTSEYFCYDPFSHELLGWRIVDTKYHPIPPDANGRLRSVLLNGWLGLWEGEYAKLPITWLRVFDDNGKLMPTSNEAAVQHADEAEHRADEAIRRADALEAEVARLRAQLGDAGSESV